MCVLSQISFQGAVHMQTRGHLVTAQVVVLLPHSEDFFVAINITRNTLS